MESVGRGFSLPRSNRFVKGGLKPRPTNAAKPYLEIVIYSLLLVSSSGRAKYIALPIY